MLLLSLGGVLPLPKTGGIGLRLSKTAGLVLVKPPDDGLKPANETGPLLEGIPKSLSGYTGYPNRLALKGIILWRLFTKSITTERVPRWEKTVEEVALLGLDIHQLALLSELEVVIVSGDLEVDLSSLGHDAADVGASRDGRVVGPHPAAGS